MGSFLEVSFGQLADGKGVAEGSEKSCFLTRCLTATTSPKTPEHRGQRGDVKCRVLECHSWEAGERSHFPTSSLELHSADSLLGSVPASSLLQLQTLGCAWVHGDGNPKSRAACA